MISQVRALELFGAIALVVTSASAQEAATAVAEQPAPAPVLLIPPPAPRAVVPPPIQTVPVLSPPPAPPAPPPQLAVTTLAGGVEKLEWFQSPVLFLPGQVKAGSASLAEQDTIFQAPLVWALAGRLGSDVTIAGPGEPVTLKAGDILPRVNLRIGAGIDQRYTLYCTRNRVLQKVQSSGWLAKLQRNIMDSMNDAQWCLQDTDNDGKLDLAVVLNAGAPVTEAAKIEPVAFEASFAVPIPGDEDHLTMSMYRVGKKEVGILLSIKQMGRALKFDTLTSGYYAGNQLTNIPYAADGTGMKSILGVRIKVSEPDQKGNRASIEWLPVADRGPFVQIPSELVMTVR